MGLVVGKSEVGSYKGLIGHVKVAMGHVTFFLKNVRQQTLFFFFS